MKPIFTRSQKPVSVNPDSDHGKQSETQPTKDLRGEKRLALFIGLIALVLNLFIWVKPHFGGFEYLTTQTSQQMHIAALARNASRGLLSVDPVVDARASVQNKVLQQASAEYGLFPWLVGLVFRLFDTTDFWALFPIWICYGLLLVVGFLFARLFLSRRWSIVVVVLTAIAPVVIRGSTSLLPDLPASVLVLVFLLCLARGTNHWILGVVFGFVCWLKPGFFPLLIPAVWLCNRISGRRNPKSIAMAFILGWLCAVWPMIIRNILAAGNPFHSMFQLKWGVLPFLVPALVLLVHTGFGSRRRTVGFFRKAFSISVLCVYVVVCLVNFPPVVGVTEDEDRLTTALIDFLDGH
ncbi:MAG TPA: glycosyltransferase family 39 protein, partial [bacterium]|nr:glycosyltransferase family 39 protein [bacterium]